MSKEDIAGAGFMPEAADYGFSAIYPAAYEDYKALIRYYILKRKELEFEMLKYEAGKSTIEEVETCYIDYCTAKSKLTDYVNSVTPGDI
jgi:GTP-binding protein EngB required for normal cell division